ncbi:ATP-binding protein [Mangrovimonas sp. ST2L15]|uniref:ATP-binding protein n=1 Tax=Mangrovimonas sp. ST2L15 TaxID=1645916 RepID=UPI0006B468B0|nr:ATP-binding protein [Mangrovimonas sp. ST2L15]
MAQEPRVTFELDSLKLLLDKATSNEDIENEILIREKLFRLELEKIANYGQALSDGLSLEPLVNKNIHIASILNIAPSVYGGIAWLHHSNADYEKSNDYYLKAIDYAKKANQNKNVFKFRSSIGFNEYLLGRKDEAQEIMQELYIEAEKLKDTEMLSDSHYGFYTILIEENPTEALKHAKLSLNTTNSRNLSHRNINIGTCFLNMQEADSALYYTKIGEKIAIENKLIQQQANAFSQLKDIYGILGDYKNAIYYFELYDQLDRQINSYKNSLELLVSQRNQMQLREALNEEKLTNQKRIKWIGFMVAFILGMLLIYLFNRLQFIQKQKKLIEVQKTRAEQSEKYKEQFLANMSHEIRTPMHAISGITNNLIRNKHPEYQQPYLEAMKTSSDNLLVLLDDILDLSKIESGKLKIEEKWFSPKGVVQSTVQSLQYRAEEKGLCMETHFSQNFPDQILGDAARLSQVLINLISNAIKFSDKGTISISVESKNTPSSLIFKISDQGIGIPTSQIDKIFETFEQGAKSKSQIYKGTGLGLSISKRLIELQGGRIWVNSKENRGSDFYFELPAKTQNYITNTENDLQGISLDQLGKSLTGLTVLLVEDDEFNIMVVQDDLNYYIPDVNMTLAKNGKEAIDLYKKQAFDIILMDMHMPIMDGCEATEMIRKLEIEASQSQIPIIAMTANSITSEIQKCLASGMTDYISKPYKIEILLSKIAKYQDSSN